MRSLVACVLGALGAHAIARDLACERSLNRKKCPTFKASFLLTAPLFNPTGQKLRASICAEFMVSSLPIVLLSVLSPIVQANNFDNECFSEQSKCPHLLDHYSVVCDIPSSSIENLDCKQKAKTACGSELFDFILFDRRLLATMNQFQPACNALTDSTCSEMVLKCPAIAVAAAAQCPGAIVLPQGTPCTSKVLLACPSLASSILSRGDEKNRDDIVDNNFGGFCEVVNVVMPGL